MRRDDNDIPVSTKVLHVKRQKIADPMDMHR
jgi:hypothetical protein